MNDGASGMLAITVALDLVEGGLPEFLQLVRENAALSVAREPGCLRFDVLTPLERRRGRRPCFCTRSTPTPMPGDLRSEHYPTSTAAASRWCGASRSPAFRSPPTAKGAIRHDASALDLDGTLEPPDPSVRLTAGAFSFLLERTGQSVAGPSRGFGNWNAVLRTRFPQMRWRTHHVAPARFPGAAPTPASPRRAMRHGRSTARLLLIFPCVVIRDPCVPTYVPISVTVRPDLRRSAKRKSINRDRRRRRCGGGRSSSA